MGLLPDAQRQLRNDVQNWDGVPSLPSPFALRAVLARFPRPVHARYGVALPMRARDVSSSAAAHFVLPVLTLHRVHVASAFTDHAAAGAGRSCSTGFPTGQSCSIISPPHLGQARSLIASINMPLPSFTRPVSITLSARITVSLVIVIDENSQFPPAWA